MNARPSGLTREGGGTCPGWGLPHAPSDFTRQLPPGQGAAVASASASSCPSSNKRQSAMGLQQQPQLGPKMRDTVMCITVFCFFEEIDLNRHALRSERPFISHVV